MIRAMPERKRFFSIEVFPKMVNNFSRHQKMNRDINSFSNIHDTMDPTEDIIMCFTLTSRFLALFLPFLPKCINVLRSDIDVLIKTLLFLN